MKISSLAAITINQKSVKSQSKLQNNWKYVFALLLENDADWEKLC
jgi:hypothetical protein